MAAVSQKRINHIAERGKQLYESTIRAVVEPEHTGKFLVLDVDTGDYEVDADEVAAFGRMIDKNPDAERFLVRIGYKTAHSFGGGLRLENGAPENN